MDTAIFTAVASIVAPVLVALLKQWNWSSGAKRWFSFAVSIVLAAAVVWYEVGTGKVSFSGSDTAGYIFAVVLAVVGGAQIVYAVFRKSFESLTESVHAPQVDPNVAPKA